MMERNRREYAKLPTFSKASGKVTGILALLAMRSPDRRLCSFKPIVFE